MKSLKSSGKPKKLKPPLLIKRVSGTSMEPTLKEGRVLVGWRWFRALKPGDIVIFEHKNIEKIKRIQKLTDDKLFVVGDNPKKSTDSRQFGWIDKNQVKAKKL